MVEFCKLSYLAALLDGEGYVAWTRETKTHKSRLILRITMTDEPLIDWLKETFGGYKYDKKPWKDHYKPQWGWSLEGYAAEKLYRVVGPLMKIKGRVTEWDKGY